MRVVLHTHPDVSGLHYIDCFFLLMKMQPAQLQLFPWDSLTPADLKNIHSRIRNSYWHVRNLRGGRFSQAALRRHYRMIANEKKRLQLAGVEKREILDLLKCCRLKCGGKKPPFERCQFCL